MAEQLPGFRGGETSKKFRRNKMADLPALENDCVRHARAPIEQAVLRVESSANPYAIGVVKGRLAWQPRTKEEAVATARSLKAQGFNFSMGCRQVNLANLNKYGLDLVSVFDPAKNSLVGNAIYDECGERAVAKFGPGVQATKAALSCYYSGNFTRGQQKEGNAPSYADKVLSNLPTGAKALSQAIPVVVIKGKKPKHQANDTPGAGEVAVAQQAEQKQTASWDVFKEF
jgi:type IV secretion system protein VirB1